MEADKNYEFSIPYLILIIDQLSLTPGKAVLNKAALNFEVNKVKCHILSTCIRII
jgi:hypothetical protein